MRRITILWCAWGGLFGWAAALGQQAGAPEPQASIRVDINLIVLNATVLDRSGQPVSGLEKENFGVTVDGQPRPITVFQKDDAPVVAGILVDNSASMEPKGPEVLAAALAFARASNAQDEMFIVHFSDQIRFGLPPAVRFSNRIPELETALSQFKPAGATALYDAVAVALSHLRSSMLERKVLLIISDGGDNSSQILFPALLSLIQTSGAAVYAVGLYDDTDRDRNPRVLSQLTELTGGKAFFPAALSDITRICTGIAGDVRRQYTLGIQGLQDGRYHRIQVTARDPNKGQLDVHSRSGYFAREP